MRPILVDPAIKTWATLVQQQYIDAVNEHGSMRAASRALDLNFSTVQAAIASAKQRAAIGGYSPEHGMTHGVPSPFIVKGVSTLYGDQGQMKAQWVKTKVDDTRLENALRDFVAHLIEDAKGTSKPVPAPKQSNDDLLAVYPMGDPHFGMYSWAAETGEDFDTELAEKLTIGAVDRLVASAPQASYAVILPLGDVLHADDTKNRTPASGNQLDVDTRHRRVMMIALKALKHCIYRALEKHQSVTVRIVQGNHDPHASFAISLALAEHFSNNKRVSIDLSPSLFWYYRFGKVLIGATHGDTAKAKDLLGVMASDRAEDWGQTKFRYFYHGHLHQAGVKEAPGLLIEWFRTLAPADAWAAGQGYRSGRDMYCIVFNKNFGEVERHRCDVAMLQ